MSWERLGLDLRLQKRFGCGLLTFDCSKSSFNFFSELLARLACNTLDPFFHTTSGRIVKRMVFWGIEEA